MPTLRLDRLTKVYDDAVRALDGVDLTIEGHELVALVGNSSCGKTTLLRTTFGPRVVCTSK